MVTQYIYYNKDRQGQFMQETKHHIFMLPVVLFPHVVFFLLHIKEVYGTSKHQNKDIKKIQQQYHFPETVVWLLKMISLVVSNFV